jgi:hypothetical protein
VERGRYGISLLWAFWRNRTERSLSQEWVTRLRCATMQFGLPIMATDAACSVRLRIVDRAAFEMILFGREQTSMPGTSYRVRRPVGSQRLGSRSRAKNLSVRLALVVRMSGTAKRCGAQKLEFEWLVAHQRYDSARDDRSWFPGTNCEHVLVRNS